VFPTDDANIEPEQLEYIKNVAPMMIGKLNRVEVRGHCLRRPLPQASPYSDHWQLCYARCQAVKTQLETLGIERERIRLSQAEGNEPLALNLTPEDASSLVFATDHSQLYMGLLPPKSDEGYDTEATVGVPLTKVLGVVK
jgi:flagellar motor protein MotB